MMNLYDTKEYFFIRANKTLGPDLETLVIDKQTLCMSIQKDDKLLKATVQC